MSAILFKSVEARDFLFKNKEIYVIGGDIKPNGQYSLMYKGVKQGMVLVKLVFSISVPVPGDLHSYENLFRMRLLPYIDRSGFDSLDEWVDHAYFTNVLHLYHVKLLKGVNEINKKGGMNNE